MSQIRTGIAEDLGGLFSDEEALSSLGQTLGDVAEVTGRLVLRLEDLIEDDNGEVVLFNDSHVPGLALATDAKLVARGQIQDHITVTGEDVSGYKFLSFETGTTIYFSDSLDLTVVDAAVSC